MISAKLRFILKALLQRQCFAGVAFLNATSEWPQLQRLRLKNTILLLKVCILTAVNAEPNDSLVKKNKAFLIVLIAPGDTKS